MDQAPGPTVPWDHKAQLNGPGQAGLEIDNLLHPPKPQSSAASHSVVNDYGDAEHLAENRSNVSLGVSTADLTLHTGAGFTNTSDLPALRESDISNEGEGTPLEGDLKDKSEDRFPEAVNLGQSIRASTQRSANGREEREFLPIDALERTITRTRVQQEIRDVVPFEKLEDFTAQIWEVTSAPFSKSPSKKTTRRKIFAILALMQKTSEIVGFIEEKLYDSDLPFIISDGSSPGLRQLVCKGNDDELHRIQLFAKWSTFELEYFSNAQRHFLAPYFRLSTKEKPKIKHYVLENQSILPFIENEEKREGGFSDVWRVKIHPAHHNYCKDSATLDENPNFALKHLRHNSFEDFRTEVENLKRFSAKDHLHLIKLLVTFSWGEQYYLLFPWADGNLLDFWKSNPKPSNPLLGHQVALWFSKQCLGIVEGLKMIHTLDTPLTGDLSDVSSRQIHGRHGDLKPENILWFKSYQDTDTSCFMGVLKISDFGLTRFHGPMSKSHVDARGLGMSPTYRAPEYDIGKQVSQSYDIWTLGCVLLEFVTWYLLGWDEVDIFSKERTLDDDIEFKDLREDAFFNYVKLADDNGRIGARAKKSVADEFKKLYEHKDCFDFMLDLLQFIEHKLLRMGPKKRAGCEEIVTWFTGFHRMCSENPKYCTESIKEPPEHVGTDLSLLYPSSFEFSPEMDKKLKRYSLTEFTGRWESDASSHTAQLPPQISGTESSRNNMPLPRKAQLESQIRIPEKMDPITEPQTSALVALAGTGDDEQKRPRPPSPSRKVHFKQERIRKESNASEHKDEMSTMKDMLRDTPPGNEGASEVDHLGQIQPHATSPDLRETSEIPASRIQVKSTAPSDDLIGVPGSKMTDPLVSATAVPESPKVMATTGNDLVGSTSNEGPPDQSHKSSEPQSKAPDPLHDVDVINHESDSHAVRNEANGSATRIFHQAHKPVGQHTNKDQKLISMGSSSQNEGSDRKIGIKRHLKRCKSFLLSRLLSFKDK